MWHELQNFGRDVYHPAAPTSKTPQNRKALSNAAA
jgi:hypothetical protein